MGNNIDNRMVNAATRFFMHRGYGMLDRDVEDFIVIIDEDVDASEEHPDIVFVKMYDMSMEEDPSITASEFEAIAVPWLANSGFSDVTLRYDTLGFLVVGDERALLKHHINAEIVKR